MLFAWLSPCAGLADCRIPGPVSNTSNVTNRKVVLLTGTVRRASFSDNTDNRSLTKHLG
jgi:hypothetical protein